jgi:hypothetical protein
MVLWRTTNLLHPMMICLLIFHGRPLCSQSIDATLPQEEARDLDCEQTRTYFERELVIRNGAGGRGIVSESFFDPLERKFMNWRQMISRPATCLQMAILVNSLSSRQNTMLAGFLNLFLTKIGSLSLNRT